MQSKRIFQVLRFIGFFIISILLTYAVLFSITFTVLIIYGYKTVIHPLREVQYLVDHNPKETVFIKQYRLEMKKKGGGETISHIFIPLDSVSKHLKNAVIAAEDDGFYTHPGFDIEAILNAYQYNRVHNRNARGASTITQQLAKNLFLSDEKKFSRKFKELGYTLLMEKILGKDRILELYLNYAQWGDSIFGCEAAAQRYFKKSSSKLTLGESVRLAATLASPERLSPLNVKALFLQKRVEVIANNLYLKHIIDDAGYVGICGILPPKDSTQDTINHEKLKEAARREIAEKYFSKPTPPSTASRRGHRY